MEKQKARKRLRRRLFPKHIRNPFLTPPNDPEYDLILKEYNEWLRQGGGKKIENEKTE